jgi:hypothetical protein
MIKNYTYFNVIKAIFLKFLGAYHLFLVLLSNKISFRQIVSLGEEELQIRNIDLNFWNIFKQLQLNWIAVHFITKLEFIRVY